jgi:hypothetical protein
MRRIFNLKIAGEESGGPLGGTAPYDVILLEKCTVREFVEYVLDTKSDWGYIGIYNPERNPFFGDPHIEYSNGKLKSKTSELNFGEFLDKPVIKATAGGGWSRMDYILYV